MKASNNTLRVPVVGHMVRCADGTYHLDAEKSVWEDISADLIARFLIEKFGGDIPGIETQL